MRTFRYISLLLALALVLNAGPALGRSIPYSAPEAVYKVRFVDSECQFVVPPETNPKCGYLVVPEDRSQARGPSVRLHVAIFKSFSTDPKSDPMVYLEGGPGGSALGSVSYYYDHLIKPFLAERDFILFDQRGVGYSEPHLDCPELSGLGYDTIGQYLLPKDAVKDQLKAIVECQARLVNEGVNLSAYNSAESAADLDDLRIALGYDQWNIIGISYGTRLALTAMRDYPEGIRSVILDSTYPLQVDLYGAMPASVSRALGTLFQNCQADTQCDKAYPDLERVFYKLVQQLNAHPVTISVEGHDAPVDVLLSGSSLIGIMFRFLYSELYIPSLPRLIFDARRGDYQTLAEIQLDISLGSGASMGMYFSVQCHEEVPFSTADSVLANSAIYPDVQNFFNGNFYLGKAILSICQLWGAGQSSSIENDPVISDIPTLILSGEYDPITPPQWAAMVSATLPHSFVLNFQGMGHGIVPTNDCTLGIAQAFVDNLSRLPENGCAADTIKRYFVVPGAPVTMIPFTNAEASITSLSPENWIGVKDGIFYLSPLPGDPMLTIKSLSESDFQDYAYYHPVYNLDFTQSPIRTIESNGLSWGIYVFDQGGIRYVFGLAERGDGGTYLIELRMKPDQEKWLYTPVFLTALKAFKPL